MSITRRQDPNKDSWNSITFMVFDTPSSEPYDVRMNKISNKLSGMPKDFIQILPWELCKNEAHLKQALNMIEQKNGEGLILRCPNAGYSYGRTSLLLKVKSYKDAEAVIVGHEPGKGKHQGTVGALKCKDLLSGIAFKLGTGLSDAQRKKPPQTGDIVTYKYFEHTKKGAPGSPYFYGFALWSS